MTDDDDTVTTAALARLLDVTPKTIAELGKAGIIEPGPKRGTWMLQAGVSGYCAHLREQAAGRGGETGADARARLGQAQTTLAEVKAKQLSGELVDVSEVERTWTSACKTIRSRVLPVADRVRDLDPRDHVKLSQESRGASSDISGGA